MVHIYFILSLNKRGTNNYLNILDFVGSHLSLGELLRLHVVLKHFGGWSRGTYVRRVWQHCWGIDL